MCYSAQVHEAYLTFCRKFGADLDFDAFVRIYVERKADRRIRIPRAVDRLFANAATDDVRTIKAAIDEFDAEEATRPRMREAGRSPLRPPAAAGTSTA